MLHGVHKNRFTACERQSYGFSLIWVSVVSRSPLDFFIAARIRSLSSTMGPTHT
jgi:hypothetical protein